MPTYEYQCNSCGRRTEAVQSFSDEPLRECPHCGGQLRRVFHPVGIVLKGSGFYSTDNRGKSKEASKDKGAETKPSETKTSETKTAETKTSDAKKDSGTSGSGAGSAAAK